ncbi:hypothetical protein H696_00722 [Fonticula alba]|uniref:Helicase ATP-binding domain-containing protein n=1 Tax=Fonticula alba TaxID=691883 RepID=A0A058ZFP6_FONAL|nr:hypothetical protein H696_00722 [Fonticula alba]KCV73179.1 hypothetical protein H696_00722 [Fonticula alba]|eukprot:XP_009492880.1 hypothetical protein H696_00722 [Fonticula alba]
MDLCRREGTGARPGGPARQVPKLEGALHRLATPERFAFPFAEPYPGQMALMRAIYATAEAGDVGLFESPTGTGKSLSLICGAATWLFDRLEMADQLAEQDPSNERSDLRALAGGSPGPVGDTPSWLSGQLRRRQAERMREQCAQRRRTRHQVARRVADSCRALSREGSRTCPPADRRPVDPASATEADPFLIEDPTEGEPPGSTAPASLRAERLLFPSGGPGGLFSDSETESDGEDDGGDSRSGLGHAGDPQIIYASRTHSQISQFVGEIARTSFASALRVVTLASRKSLCINPEVNVPGRAAAQVNDHCADLLGGKGKCSFHGDATRTQQVGDLLQASRSCAGTARSLGQRLGACPYFGARAAAASAHIVCVPYSVLLSAPTRRAAGLRLRGRLVLIDEAHNVCDAVAAAHSVTLSLGTLGTCLGQVSQYLARYMTRLGPVSVVRVRELHHVARILIRHLQGSASGPASPGAAAQSEAILTSHDLLRVTGLDALNIPRLLDFLRQSRLPQKLQGFVEATDGPEVAITDRGPPKQRSAAATFQVVSFLECLLHADASGRIVLSRAPADDSRTSYRYILLDVEAKFMELVAEARSVILVGGTLRPTDLLRQQLLRSHPADRIRELACPHVVGPEALLARSLGSIAPGSPLRLVADSWAADRAPTTLADVGQVVAAVARAAPDGLVVFFPSFAALFATTDAWRASAGIFHQLHAIKEIFIEPRDSAQLDGTLKAYAASVARHGSGAATPVGTRNGAMLLCVMGGKLSEGINFADHLGRAVIVLGLPYPNKHSVELREKMAFLDSLKRGRLSELFYEDLCMRSVAQSIGRVLRHQNDYAAIVLVDVRYNSPRVLSRIPQWVVELGQLRHLGGGASSAETPSGPEPLRALTAAITEFFDRREHTAKRDLGRPNDQGQPKRLRHD